MKSSLKEKVYLENFIKRAQEKHKSKYDYSLAVWSPKGGKLEIICPIHGSFWQNPYGHLKSSGCTRCGKMKVSLRNFIERSESFHKNKYDYSRVRFLTTRDKVEIVCPIHGSFYQEPAGHMRGHGCSICSNGDSRITFENFLKRAVESHGSTYTYIEDAWDGSSHTRINCRVHGEFRQNWFNHVKGNGCSDCNFDRLKLSQTEFIDRANKAHNSKYDYSKTSFESTSEKATITCNIHGDFDQWINNHLSGQGCPACAIKSISKGEKELANFIKSLGYEVVENDRSILRGKEIDVLIPSLNIGFEYNGDYWHSDEVIRGSTGLSAVDYHSSKMTNASKAGLTLYFVWESDWLNSRNLVEIAIKDILETVIENSDPNKESIALLAKLTKN